MNDEQDVRHPNRLADQPNEQSTQAHRPTRSSGISGVSGVRRKPAAGHEHLATLLGALTQLRWLATPEEMEAHAFPVWAAYTGQFAGRAQGAGWPAAVHPADRRRVERSWATALTAGTLYHDTFRLRRADGVYRVVEMRATPLFDARGRLGQWSCDLTDVSDRDGTAGHPLAFWSGGGDWESIFDAVSEAVAIYDRHGALAHTNTALRLLLATEREPAFEQLPLAQRMRRLDPRNEWGEPLREEDWPPTRFLRGETLTGSQAIELRLRVLDGRELRISMSGAPMRDQRNQIVGAVAVFRDVTERRRLERRTHQALEALLEMAEALVSGEGDETEARPMRETARRLAELTRALLGCQRATIHSIQEPEETMHPFAVVGMSEVMERAWWAEWEQHPRLSDVASVKTLSRLKSGEVVTFDLRQSPGIPRRNPYQIMTLLLAPMRLGERLVGVLALDHDTMPHAYTADEIALAGAVANLVALVVERERLLAEREAARANALALREANRQMDEFLSMASHELRNPLTAIRASIQLTMRRIRRTIQQAEEQERQLVPLLEALLDPLQRGERQTGLLDRLIGDLLDVSRIQSGRLELRTEVTDLREIVLEAVDQQRVANPQRQIDLTLSADAPTPLLADPDRIAQVVTNYLSNALKYSPEHQPVAVTLHVERDAARVSVRDAGPGLAQEEQDRVWERFHRAPGITTAEGKTGLGLGLYISHNLIERHGGQVGVESSVGHGSTFWFTLPLFHGG